MRRYVTARITGDSNSALMYGAFRNLTQIRSKPPMDPYIFYFSRGSPKLLRAEIRSTTMGLRTEMGTPIPSDDIPGMPTVLDRKRFFSSQILGRFVSIFGT